MKREERTAMKPQVEAEYIDTKRVAERFGLSVSWLTKNRIYATGADLLPFVTVGVKVLYKVETVRSWLAARERVAS
jgi:hypothetical protein